MGVPAKKLLRLLVEHDPASPEFREGVRETLGERPLADRPLAEPRGLELNAWQNVFVERTLPWGRFAESALLHACALVLIWTLSLVWLRQQKILAPTPFDRSSLITYSLEEYLPPLDTGAPEAPKPQKGDPVLAKQPILSVPREADNRSQTIVVPPDVKLNHDVPLPNIVATGAIVPVVPLNAAGSLGSRVNAPDPQVVAPAPEVDFARNRVTQAALKSEIIPPPAETRIERARSISGPEAAVVEPPPDLTTPAKGRSSSINIAASTVVAPAPQLPLAEQHALSGRGQGGGKDLSAGNAQPVAPPPSLPGGAGGGSGQGRLIALGIHPVTPSGPVPLPSGNRRGAFEAGPKGKAGASGTPDFKGSRSDGIGSNGSANSGSGLKGRNASSLPSGLHVGAVPGNTASIARDGASGGEGEGAGGMASIGSEPAAGRRTAAVVDDSKVTDVDRQVFGDRRLYGTTLNMPNLNSATGSWVMHFAELQPGQKQGDLLQPLPTGTSDPGYPLELMRANVHGTVTLHAVIHSDGRVDDIRVLNSPDDRRDHWAISALAHWKFLPALRAGKPVAIEAVVEIPFRMRKAF